MGYLEGSGYIVGFLSVFFRRVGRGKIIFVFIMFWI